MESTYLSCAETAKLVRTALAKHFPGQKFSVRSKVYSGGAAVDVDWVLGPTAKEVDAIAGQYESASFDGSIDMEIRYTHWLLPDGSTRVESTPGSEGSLGYIPKVEHQPMPEGAKMVTFGAHYVQCQRRFSADYKEESAFIEKVAREMCILQKVAYTGPYTMHLFGDGDYQKNAHDYASELIWKTSFKPGEEYAGIRYATEEERNSKDWDPWAVFVMIKKGGNIIAPKIQSEANSTDKPPVANNITVRENKEKNGIEILFPSKPSAAVINTMKANGFRWSHSQGLWYNKLSGDSKAFALLIQGGVM